MFKLFLGICLVLCLITPWVFAAGVTWKSKAPVPTAGSPLATAAVGDKISAFSGFSYDDSTGAIPLRGVGEVFHPPAALRLAAASPPPRRVSVFDAYDNFDGDEIDANRWRIYGSAEIFSQYGGQLHADGPPNRQQATLKSRQTISGDFDFILEYNGFSTTATTGTDYSPQLYLNVSCGREGDEFVFIFKNMVGDSWNKIISNAYIDGMWRQGVGGDGTGNSGLLRVTRTGSTIKTYYYEDGRTDWESAGNFTNAFTAPVNLEIQVLTAYDGTFHVSCDGVYQGSEVLIISNPRVPLPLLFFDGE